MTEQPAGITPPSSPTIADWLPRGALVLDLGGGGSELAGALEARGCRVIGLPDGAVRWLEVPVEDIDAAIGFGPLNVSGSAYIERLLRTIRDRLAADGLIVLAANGETWLDWNVLLRACGFAPIASPWPERIVAKRAPQPPDSLAVNLHHAAPQTGLNLRWSPDEAEFLSPAPTEIWARLAASDMRRIACDYALADPWGGARAAPVLSTFFRVDLPAGNIAFGAGATGLLRQLAPLARAGRLLASPFAHPDFLSWATAEGAELGWIGNDQDDEELCATIAAFTPHVVHLERPSPCGAILDADGVLRVCVTARRHGAIVVIDEAYLAYFAGAMSAVTIAPMADNLIVVRSLSKAYCAGGLRVGFAVAGGMASRALRRLTAPLQVSELAFQMGLMLLEAGDIFTRLRARIATGKPSMVHALGRLGLDVAAGHAELPWTVIDDASGEAAALLEAHGISGKRLCPFGAAQDGGLLRMAVPLSDERRAQFLQAMSGRR
ncbi:aminotransferase class I/II-fold pyridoxal phosphate-dependent enzyme [Bradyrhizobium elkanii]|uniref:aminotransferase class I/II-fold pyridoxal phosphate-dependent enzyme n=1 Tax=Bradyrhizobium elkanii TaxID=29448 RepID=UPI001BADF202|nr:aminotransferase class I/II-fold pyridoxal phosphate-dependent enzyme [Bradyrhizobium elkanii]MBR1158083.1 aminotransferase class I/II-fold pyridoxal phosphate-dependent enzyme [Bradyrhizobium elkanii]